MSPQKAKCRKRGSAPENSSSGRRRNEAPQPKKAVRS